MGAERSAALSRPELVRGAVWSLIGLVAPLVFALYAIPRLIAGYGMERFGLLSILWMLVGYFSLFDMGFGRALTQLAAQRIGAGRTDEIPRLVWSALWLMLSMGIVGALLLFLVAPPLVAKVLTVPPSLVGEGIGALRLLAFGIPVVIVSSGLVAVLEAHHRFGVVSVIRVPSGILNFGGPLVGLLYSDSLVVATAALLLVRATSFVAYFAAASAVERGLRTPRRPSRDDVCTLAVFGGWMTVSNVVGPLMVYFDRLVIGALGSLRDVAFYTTPYEVLSRTQTVPMAVTSVLFPAASRALEQEPLRLTLLVSMTLKAVAVVMLPITCGAFLVAPELLDLWLGPDFAAGATGVVRWLAMGYLVNAMARMPHAILQASRRPDLVAKAHLAEVLPYVALLWLLTTMYGVTGAAAAWFIRALGDFVLLSELAGHRVGCLQTRFRSVYVIVAAALCCLGTVALLNLGLAVRGGLVLVLIIACLVASLPLLGEIRVAFRRRRAVPAKGQYVD